MTAATRIRQRLGVDPAPAPTSAPPAPAATEAIHEPIQADPVRSGSLLYGDICADERAHKTPEEIAAARGVSVEVVRATLAHDKAACDAYWRKRFAEDPELALTKGELDLRRRVRGAVRRNTGVL